VQDVIDAGDSVPAETTQPDSSPESVE
jgi:hypothetical protein